MANPPASFGDLGSHYPIIESFLQSYIPHATVGEMHNLARATVFGDWGRAWWLGLGGAMRAMRHLIREEFIGPSCFDSYWQTYNNRRIMEAAYRPLIANMPREPPGEWWRVHATRLSTCRVCFWFLWHYNIVPPEAYDYRGQSMLAIMSARTGPCPPALQLIVETCDPLHLLAPAYINEEWNRLDLGGHSWGKCNLQIMFGFPELLRICLRRLDAFFTQHGYDHHFFEEHHRRQIWEELFWNPTEWLKALGSTFRRTDLDHLQSCQVMIERARTNLWTIWHCLIAYRCRDLGPIFDVLDKTADGDRINTACFDRDFRPGRWHPWAMAIQRRDRRAAWAIAGLTQVDPASLMDIADPFPPNVQPGVHRRLNTEPAQVPVNPQPTLALIGIAAAFTLDRDGVLMLREWLGRSQCALTQMLRESQVINIIEQIVTTASHNAAVQQGRVYVPGQSTATSKQEFRIMVNEATADYTEHAKKMVSALIELGIRRQVARTRVDGSVYYVQRGLCDTPAWKVWYRGFIRAPGQKAKLDRVGKVRTVLRK